jgi:hypothetical protein
VLAEASIRWRDVYMTYPSYDFLVSSTKVLAEKCHFLDEFVCTGINGHARAVKPEGKQHAFSLHPRVTSGERNL